MPEPVALATAAVSAVSAVGMKSVLQLAGGAVVEIHLDAGLQVDVDILIELHCPILIHRGLGLGTIQLLATGDGEVVDPGATTVTVR